jgi:hypothetical protein
MSLGGLVGIIVDIGVSWNQSYLGVISIQCTTLLVLASQILSLAISGIMWET